MLSIMMGPPRQQTAAVVDRAAAAVADVPAAFLGQTGASALIIYNG